jgi:hypothetical protein
VYDKPYRTPAHVAADGTITPGIHGQTPDFNSGITPVRDRLNINAEDMVFDDQLKQVSKIVI